ncbi:MAG TPA: hypothetical protein VI875_02520 [Candidatus Norongarragalinales archaeon]|nr:hypothetical protein [Candidatus Norongarragalinales archaeon]
MDSRDIASGLIALLFIVAVGYYILQPPAGQKPVPSASPLLSSPTPLPSPANLQLECDKNLAGAFNFSDSGECYKISCPQTREYCLGSLNRNEANCAKAGKYEDDCFSSLAIFSRKTALCEKISDEGKKRFCLAGISLNASLCLGISFIPSRDACFSALALNADNASLCQNIEDERVKEGCLNVLG